MAELARSMLGARMLPLNSTGSPHEVMQNPIKCQTTNSHLVVRRRERAMIRFWRHAANRENGEAISPEQAAND
jgi:hypothetical protein